MGRGRTGEFKPKNPQKYRGRSRIIFRSLWELKYMIYCDMSDSILEWSSEEIVIPYYDARRSKWHRYYTDFWVRYKNPDGTVGEKLIEIKPYKQYVPPVKPKPNAPKKKIEGYHNAMKTYYKNQLKWEAAERYAKKNGMQFVVMTERDLGIGR